MTDAPAPAPNGAAPHDMYWRQTAAPSPASVNLSSSGITSISLPVANPSAAAPSSPSLPQASPALPPQSARVEADAQSRPLLAPRDAVARQAAPSLRAQVGVVIALSNRPSPHEIAAAEANMTTAYSTIRTEGDGAPPATPSGVHLVESPAGSAYGRLCNAGYRHLKKLNADLRFVQFLEEGAKLDPQWVDAALKFMERRPEVAVVEGRGEAPPAAPLAATVSQPPGEAQAVGRTFLVRAEAFEAAGGFRGDLLVNETADLCIRLRRRGAHVWRIEDRMCMKPAVDKRAWWGDAVSAGYAYAHGMRLHGAEPEQLFFREHARSIMWGAAIPVLIGALGIGAGVFTVLNGTIVDGLIALAATLFLGVAIYAARVAVIAYRHGVAKRASWAYAVRVVAGQFGEFLGACRFYLSGTDPRRSAA